MIEADGMHFNKRWGYLSRAGVNDKSQLMRQIEKYADIFTSRVSNFLRYTPFEVGGGVWGASRRCGGGDVRGGGGTLRCELQGRQQREAVVACVLLW
jgi:hypothetical protein